MQYKGIPYSQEAYQSEKQLHVKYVQVWQRLSRSICPQSSPTTGVYLIIHL